MQHKDVASAAPSCCRTKAWHLLLPAIAEQTCADERKGELADQAKFMLSPRSGTEQRHFLCAPLLLSPRPFAEQQIKKMPPAPLRGATDKEKDAMEDSIVRSNPTVSSDAADTTRPRATNRKLIQSPPKQLIQLLSHLSNLRRPSCGGSPSSLERTVCSPPQNCAGPKGRTRRSPRS